MAKVLLPPAFWFRFAMSCPRVDHKPRRGDSDRLLDLPERCALPDLAELEGRKSWAEVRLGWNPGGLGIAVLAQGVMQEQLMRDRPEGFAEAQFWIDTRDTRDVARATRFCHRFVAQLTLGASPSTLDVKVSQRPIARAVADAPMSRSELIASRTKLSRTGWTLELFLPAEAMNGF